VELGRTALVIACTVEHAANAAQALATAKFRIGNQKLTGQFILALPLLKALRHQANRRVEPRKQ
jgi:hypothetical protein